MPLQKKLNLTGCKCPPQWWTGLRTKLIQSDHHDDCPLYRSISQSGEWQKSPSTGDPSPYRPSTTTPEPPLRQNTPLTSPTPNSQCEAATYLMPSGKEGTSEGLSDLESALRVLEVLISILVRHQSAGYLRGQSGYSLDWVESHLPQWSALVKELSLEALTLLRSETCNAERTDPVQDGGESV